MAKIDLALAYIKSNQKSKASELLNTVNINQLSTAVKNQISLIYNEAGNNKRAMEILYQCIQERPSQQESQDIYFNLFVFRNKSDSDFPPQMDEVCLDSYVKIKELNSYDEKEIIIEEKADIFTPDHELSKKFLGKKQGDTVQMHNKKYQIMEIKSKYVHQFQEISKTSELKFPLKTSIKSAFVPKNLKPEELAKELPKILQQFIPDPKKRTEQLDQLFQHYKDGKITIGAISQITGKHPVDTIEHLIQSKELQFISAMAGRENYAESFHILDNRSEMIMDISSLFIIHGIKFEPYMENSKFNLYICRSTLDYLEKLTHKRNLYSQDGLLTVGVDEKNRLIKDFVPPEIINKNLDFIEKIKRWAEKHCKIQSTPDSFIMDRDKKLKLQNLIRKDFFDSALAGYGEKNMFFLSEDGILRELSKNTFQISGVRLFDIILYFEKQQIIDKNKSAEFKAELVKLNQTYIPIDIKILMRLLKEGQYSVSYIGFQRGLFFLGPVSNLQAVIRVASDFLVELFQESSLLPYTMEVIAKEVLDRVCFGRKNPKHIASQLVQQVKSKTFYLPLHRNRICNCIERWLKTKVY